MFVCVWYSFANVIRLGPLDYTHKAQNSLQPRKSLSKSVVCPLLPGLGWDSNQGPFGSKPDALTTAPKNIMY